MATDSPSAATNSMIYTLTPEQTFTPSLTKLSSRDKYRIGSVVQSTETRNCEFKMGPYALDNIEETIQKYGSAFLNSGGGTLMLGVRDDGTVVGVSSYRFSREDVIKIITKEFEKFTPPVTRDLYEINICLTDVTNKYVVEIHVRPGQDDEIYAGKSQKMYVRRDGSVHGPLWPREIKEIVLSKLSKKSAESS